MNDYILLMYSDAVTQQADSAWSFYLAKLRAIGVFEGGSSIGAGTLMRKDGVTRSASDHLAGFIRVHAASLEAAKLLVEGNPVFECGGSVEVRELTRD